MDYYKLSALLQTNTSVRLMRAQNAALLLSFLSKEFKEPNRLSISNNELIHKLSDYLAYLDYIEEGQENDEHHEDSEHRAKRYLEIWTDHGYLRKYPDETGEHMHELTPDTEKVFQWIDSMNKKDFVGTESRFKDIFRKLRDLVDNSTSDPQARIRELERQKLIIENEIREIKIKQFVPTYDDTQIKERFYELNRAAKDLLADFKEVEQNFKDIIRNIYEKQSDKNYNKGTIIGYALDSLDELKDMDQGKSFYNFWHFLVNDKSQDELRGLIDNVYDLIDDRNIQLEDDRFLKRIKMMLYQAGKKVIESNKQLSSKLSKVLSERNLAEGRKTMELIADIRAVALKVVSKPPKVDDFTIIDGDIEIGNLMSRSLTEEPSEDFQPAIPTDGDALDLTSLKFNSLFSQFAVNHTELQENIDNFLKKKKQVSLVEILEEKPISKGLSELLTYLNIASKSTKHIISDQSHLLIEIQKQPKRMIKVPQVIYTK